MVQAINKLHVKNTVIPLTDDGFYIYDGTRWKKSSEKINYYKFYDTNISENPEESDINADDYKNNDYIISYKTKTNYIKYSEAFRPNECKIDDVSMWDIKGLTQLDNSEKFRFPNTGKISPRFQTNNNDTETVPTEHSISQVFYADSNELYLASCMIKQLTTTSHYIAFQLYDDCYEVGVTAQINLNDASGFTDIYSDDTITIQYKKIESDDLLFLDSNFNDVPSTNIVLKHIFNTSGCIYRYVDSNDNVYFRIALRCSRDFYSRMRVRLLFLNNNQEYKYLSKEGQAKYILYVNAFQLERLKNLNVETPSEYLMTASEISSLKLFDQMFQIKYISSSSSNSIKKVESKLYYIYNVEEFSEVNEGIGLITYLKSFKPSIQNPIEGDIAVVPTLISFSKYDKLKNNYKEDTMIKLGDTYLPDNPDYTINYDYIGGIYKIREGDSYKIFSVVSEKKNRQAIVKAMTFNQGYFETWFKKDTQYGVRKFGYNTGGGFNYTRVKKFFPKY